MAESRVNITMVKIFVGGLRPDISELDLVMFISLRAQVNTIKVVRDKITKRCKGYAFLEMANQAEAEKAVSLLNGETYQGQVLNIKISEEPSPEAKTKPSIPYQKKRPRN
jgi:RNA recognition motif-containing protein